MGLCLQGTNRCQVLNQDFYTNVQGIIVRGEMWHSERSQVVSLLDMKYSVDIFSVAVVLLCLFRKLHRKLKLSWVCVYDSSTHALCW